jgi:hypothetical protein
MSIQTIIDTAQSIEFDRSKTVGQSVSRSGRLKTAERASVQAWTFVVTPAGSYFWSDHRDTIEEIDANDRINEYEISLSNVNGMGFITEYMGNLNSTQLNALTINTNTTATFVLGNLPSIGATLTSRSENFTAQSFQIEAVPTYSRSFDVARNDILITNSEYDAKFYKIQVGDRLSTSTYLTSNQTVTGITRNFLTYNSVGYTKVNLSAAPNSSSGLNTPIQFTSTASTLVSTTTVVFYRGDFIQPTNSRYPYTVKNTVERGSGSTVTVDLNRAVITSEAIALDNSTLKVGVDVTWRVVAVEKPTYSIIAPNRFQFNGDFRLAEKVI